MQDLVAGQIDMMFTRPTDVTAAGARRHHQGLCGHRRGRIAGRAGHPDGRTRPGLPGFYISVWYAHLGAEGHAQDDDRAGSMPRRWRPWPIRWCGSASPISGRTSSAAEQQTPEALGAFHKAEIDKWWPIIKAAGIKVK